jgi:hypothetical protein
VIEFLEVCTDLKRSIFVEAALFAKPQPTTGQALWVSEGGIGGGGEGGGGEKERTFEVAFAEGGVEMSGGAMAINFDMAIKRQRGERDEDEKQAKALQEIEI